MKRVLHYSLIYLCLAALALCFIFGFYDILKNGTMREGIALINGAVFVLGSYFCISTIVNMHTKDNHRKLFKNLDPEKKLDDIRLNTIKLIDQDNKSELNGEDVFNTIQDCVDIISYLIKTRNK